MLHTGKSSFGVDPFAYTDSEEKANHLARACNSYEAMREALENLVTEIKRRDIAKNIRKDFSLMLYIRQAKEALALADGKETHP